MLLAQIVVQNVNSHLPIIEIVSLCLLGKQDTCALGFVTFSTVPTDVVGHHEMCVCCIETDTQPCNLSQAKVCDLTQYGLNIKVN